MQVSWGPGVRRRSGLVRHQNWSCVCQNPRCCPAGGVPFDAAAHPAAAALAAAGMPACPDRAALARSLAPLSGPDAESMARATERALRRVGELLTSAPGTADGLRRAVDEGRAAVREAIAAYRCGGRITDHERLALGHIAATGPARAALDDGDLQVARAHVACDLGVRPGPGGSAPSSSNIPAMYGDPAGSSWL